MRNIVLIADRVSSFGEINQFSENLECVEDEYYNSIHNSLIKISPKVYHYNSPKEFLNNISKHQRDVVLSIWSGMHSRNRKSLASSICEAYGIDYIGADPYVQCISQDKNLSKHICRRYGIESAKSVYVETVADISLISNLSFPIIAKPNFEGGSNGISLKNKLYNAEQAHDMINQLLEHFQQPILVEEYLKGQEISIIMAGTPDNILLIEAPQIVINDDEQYDAVFGYEAKKEGALPKKYINGTHLLCDALKDKLKKLYVALGKVDVIRIDGKVYNGEFKLIELSPDAHLGPTSSVAVGFSYAGYTYDEMLQCLIDIASNH